MRTIKIPRHQCEFKGCATCDTLYRLSEIIEHMPDATLWLLASASLDPIDHLDRNTVFDAATAIGRALNARNVPYLMALHNSVRRGRHIHIVTRARHLSYGHLSVIWEDFTGSTNVTQERVRSHNKTAVYLFYCPDCDDVGCCCRPMITNVPFRVEI